MKYTARHIDGVMLLDKSLGLSSNKALQDVKHLYRAKKAGHTGSLDPLASGLLPLCLGEATKFSSYILGADKSYHVQIKLGEQTSTADAEGEVVNTKAFDSSLTIDDLQSKANEMIGILMQVPPMYSALKVQGIPLYKLARQGKDIIRKPRRVQLYDFKIKSVDYPYVSADLTCSSGFYVRSLAEDFAAKLGTLSHVTELRRTVVSMLNLDNARTYEVLKDMTEEDRDQLLIPIDVILDKFPTCELTDNQLDKLYKGQTITNVKGLPSKDFVKLRWNGQFAGLGLIKQGNMITPKRLLSTDRLSFFNKE